MTPIELFERYRGLAHKLAYRFYRVMPNNRRFTEDDALQTAFMGLWKAAQTFDPERGAFSTLAHTIINNDLMESLETSTVIKVPSYYYRHPELFDGTVVEDTVNRIMRGLKGAHNNLRYCRNDIYHVDERSDFENVMRIAKNVLSEKDLCIVSLHVAGISFIDMCPIFGLSKQAIQQRHVRSIRRVQRAYGGGNEGATRGNRPSVGCARSRQAAVRA